MPALNYWATDSPPRANKSLFPDTSSELPSTLTHRFRVAHDLCWRTSKHRVTTATSSCALGLRRLGVAGLGPQLRITVARVVELAAVAERILNEIEGARVQYLPRMSFEEPQALYESSLTRAFSFFDEPRSSK